MGKEPAKHLYTVQQSSIASISTALTTCVSNADSSMLLCCPTQPWIQTQVAEAYRTACCYEKHVNVRKGHYKLKHAV